MADVESTVDLSDSEAFASGFPHHRFTWLREHDPVSWHEPTAKTPDGEGFWVVSRHEDVSTVLRDTATFSSDRGGIRERGGTGLKDEKSAGVMLNMTDDPQHRRLRALVSRGFTPRAVAQLEDDLRSRTHHLLDRAGNDSFDFVKEFARELPAAVICVVLGVPRQDQAQLLDWLDAGIETDSASIVAPEATAMIREYAFGLIADKRANPDGGIMSQIVNAVYEEDGTQLSDRELVAFFALLFPAGAETTRSALSGALLQFIRNPDEFTRLREDAALFTTAVEEIVRFTTPSVYKRRTASVDTSLAGTQIEAGQKVTIWEMSANRDDRVFNDPFTFDVGRDPNPHLGFGWGVHFCLGASLARLELRVALETLAERYTGFEATGPHSWTPNNRLFGLNSLPLRPIPAG